MGRIGGVPDRVAWAVDLLDVAPDDEILEVGCGPGVAVALIAERLDRGHVTAIDRSPTAVARTAGRAAEHMAAGRVVLHQVDLAGFEGEPARYDKVLAVNVNVFWTTSAEAECAVLARVLRPGGVVRLVYGGPPTGQRGDVGATIAANLARHGFTAAIVRHPGGGAFCVTGQAEGS